ncbi:hypothetical protein MRX96_018873 [Rhipicephalus microplus]
MAFSEDGGIALLALICMYLSSRQLHACTRFPQKSTSGGLRDEVGKCITSRVLCLKLLPCAVSVMTCFGLAAALPQTAEDLAARPPLPRSCHIAVEAGWWSGEWSVPLPSISTLLSFVCFDVAA